MAGGKDELESVEEDTADYDEMERYRETRGMGHSALVTKALEALFGRWGPLFGRWGPLFGRAMRFA